MSQKVQHYLSIWWQYAVVLLFSLFFGFPMLWMIYSSFKANRDIVFSIWALPNNPTLASYRWLLAGSEFKLYFLNSIIITIASVLGLVVLAAMAAYALARIRFFGSNVLFYIFLAGMMIPTHVTLVPLYTMLRQVGLLNHLLALLFPYVAFGLPVSIYILRGFFEQIPTELDEAARIDGASVVRIFWSIVLPLSRPALVTVMILSVVASWNEYLFALTFVSGNSDAYTLPIGVLALVRAVGGFYYDRALTAMTMAALPVLTFFFLMQRHIVKSLLAGAFKG